MQAWRAAGVPVHGYMSPTRKLKAGPEGLGEGLGGGEQGKWAATISAAATRAQATMAVPLRMFINAASRTPRHRSSCAIERFLPVLRSA